VTPRREAQVGPALEIVRTIGPSELHLGDPFAEETDVGAIISERQG